MHKPPPPPPKPKVVGGRIIRDGTSEAKQYEPEHPQARINRDVEVYLYGENPSLTPDGYPMPKKIKPAVIYRGDFDLSKSIWPNVILFVFGYLFGRFFLG